MEHTDFSDVADDSRSTRTDSSLLSKPSPTNCIASTTIASLEEDSLLRHTT